MINYRLIKKHLALPILLIIIGQIIFAFYSPKYITTYYENKIYATTGIKHDASDLHKLNESAHYFGETITGWTKFPNFMNKLNESVKLPESSTFNSHMQERQNMIYTVTTPETIELEALKKVTTFIQGLIDEYNGKTNTNFVLTNIDYEQVKTERSYAVGAIISLFISLLIWGGIIIVKREL